MRVLVVSTWFPTPERPGVAPFVVAHAKAIARNHDIDVVHVRLGGAGGVRQVEIAGLPAVELPVNPKRPGATLTAYRELRRLARDADVVHTMAFSTLGAMLPLYSSIGGRWVHTEHWSGVAHPDRVSRVWRSFAGARRLLRLPKRVSAVCTPLAAAIEKFARNDAVDVIPCVMADPFQAAPQPSWAPLKLVAVGGLVQGKRPVLAVDTLEELVGTGMDVTLTWVGDGPLRESVERRVAETGLADRVRLVGAVRPDEVADHLRAANLFFLPTAFDNFLTSAAEALACGRPVVLPRTGGFTDYVTEANGVLTDQDDPKSLALAVQWARDRFMNVSADAVRATVMPRFSAPAIADRFDDFYRRALR